MVTASAPGPPRWTSWACLAALTTLVAACATDESPGDSSGSASEETARPIADETTESARTLLDQRILVDSRLAIASSPDLQIQQFTLSVTGTTVSVTASADVTAAQLEQATALLQAIEGVGEVVVETTRSASPARPITPAAEGSATAPIVFAADQLAALADPASNVPEPAAEEPAAGSGPLPDQTAAAASGDRPRTYRVRAGDSLSRVAARTMGDGTQWRRIYELNRSVIGANPERLREGMELRIPQD